jgi:beta-lactamase class A
VTLHIAALEGQLAAVPGTVSVWYGPVGGPPVYARNADTNHYAASTMKVAVLAALHRAAEAGALDLDAEVPVRNEFASAAPGAPAFGCTPGYDNDDEVWARVGRSATLRWLARRMIIRSSNLATNHVIEHVGLSAVAAVWRDAGARHSVTGRGIEDYAARDAGITNDVTAADLAALLSSIATATIASRAGCDEMLEVLLSQRHREDLAAGLPPGTPIAHKNGWVEGVRHGAGIVFPDDADPYAIVVCTTTALAHDEDGDDEACRLIARVSAAAWADR